MERFMRVLVMFDMPTATKSDRKECAKFRKNLIKNGYIMMQYSVYVRICKGVSSANSYMDRLSRFIPPKGNVRALILTEKQFDNMRLLLGTPSKQEIVNKPRQLTLF